MRRYKRGVLCVLLACTVMLSNIQTSVYASELSEESEDYTVFDEYEAEEEASEEYGAEETGSEEEYVTEEEETSDTEADEGTAEGGTEDESSGEEAGEGGTEDESSGEEAGEGGTEEASYDGEDEETESDETAAVHADAGDLPSDEEESVTDESMSEAAREVQSLMDCMPEASYWESVSTDDPALDFYFEDYYEWYVNADDAYWALDENERSTVDRSSLDAFFDFVNSMVSAVDDDSAADSVTPQSTTHKTYASDAFTGDYSTLVWLIDDLTPSEVGSDIEYESSSANAYKSSIGFADNTQKSGNVYWRYDSAVRVGETFYDVVIYTWGSNSFGYMAGPITKEGTSTVCGFSLSAIGATWWHYLYDGWSSYQAGTAVTPVVYCEYHFYEHDTGTEVSLSGAVSYLNISYSDNTGYEPAVRERIGTVTGGVNSYLTSGTELYYNGNWVSCYDSEAEEDSYYDEDFMVTYTFDGSAESPFTTCWYGSWHYTTRINSTLCEIHYVVASDSEYLPVSSELSTLCTKSHSGRCVEVATCIRYGTYYTDASEFPSPYGYEKYAVYDDESLRTLITSISVVYDSYDVYAYYELNYFAYINVIKVDSETGETLDGAEFTVYEYGSNGYESTGTVLSLGEDGTFSTGMLLYTDSNQGKFRIVETGIPTGYYDDGNVLEFTINGPGTISIDGVTCTAQEESPYIYTAKDTRVTGSIDLQKYDAEAYDGTEDSFTISQGDASLAGAVYTLYAAEDVYHQDKVTNYGTYEEDGLLYAEGDAVSVSFVYEEDGVNYYVWDEDGEDVITMGEALRIVIDEVEIGSYYFIEESAGSGYLAQGDEEGEPEKIYAEVEYEGKDVLTAKVYGQTSAEHVMKQRVEFYKLSDDGLTYASALEGAGFTVYLISDISDEWSAYSDAEVKQAVIDGYRDESSLEYDAIVTSCMPAVVYADEDDEDVTSGLLVKSITYTLSDGSEYTVTTDQYGLNENAYFVNEIYSDAYGTVTTASLPYGRYVIVETTVPDGYSSTVPLIVEVTADEDDGERDNDGEGSALERMTVFLTDERITALIRITKTDSFSGREVLKEGASYIIVDTDGAWLEYYSENKTTKEINAYKEKAAYYVDGEFYGYLVLQYANGGYTGSESSPWTTAVVSTDEDGNALEVWIETVSGLPCGTYELIETKAPDGYVISGEGMEFTVSVTTVYYDAAAGSFVSEIQQPNEPAAGGITVYKEGEVLTGASQDLTLMQTLTSMFSSLIKTVKSLFGTDYQEMTEGEIRGFVNYEFEYELMPVEGAVFVITAAEDIYSQEGGSNSELIYSCGEVVCTITTDEDGTAGTYGNDDAELPLPLGNYLVTETYPGEGFALTEENAESRLVSITYEDQDTAVVFREESYENSRQVPEISVIKSDAETDEILEGAVFGLFAAEDIAGYDGTVLIEADTLIAVAEGGNDEEGNAAAVFDSDLPLAKYYIRELLTPSGYSSNTWKAGVEAIWNDDGVYAPTIEFSVEYENLLTAVMINLMDYYTEAELSGAVFEIEDSDGAAVAFISYDYTYDSFENDALTVVNEDEEDAFCCIETSASANVIIRGLSIKESYVLRQVTPADNYDGELYLEPYGKEGYVSMYAEASENVIDAECEAYEDAGAISFYVEDVCELQVVSVFAAPMSGGIEITKMGEIASGYATGEDGNLTVTYEISGLPGAEYVLTADGDIDYPDAVSGTLLSDGDIVLDTYAGSSSESLLRTVYEVKVTAGTLMNVSEYKGTSFDADASVSEREAFYNENGNDIERQIPSEEEISSGEFSFDGTAVDYVIVTDDEGKAAVSGLPLGSYTVYEVSAPDGYVRDLTECATAVVLNYEGPEISVSYVNARQKIDEETPVSRVGELIYTSDIGVTKTADGSVYEAGDTVTYTMVVYNSGETTLEHVTVSDSLDGVFTSVSSGDTDVSGVVLNGASADLGTLQSGEKVTLIYEYTIPVGTKEGVLIANTVTVTGTPVPYLGYDDEGEPVLVITQDEVTWYDISDYREVSDYATEKVKVAGGDDEEDMETVEIDRDPEITVTKEAEKEVYDAGETVVYTIEVTNTGNTGLSSVTVEEILLDEGEFTSATKGGFEGTTADIGDLAVGETVTLVYEYTLPEDAKEGDAYDNIVVARATTEKTVNVNDPENPDGTPNYLPDINVSDYDDEYVYVEKLSSGLTITKKGRGSGGSSYVEGAEYTLYAAEDIVNILGETVIEEGTKIETAVTGTDGTAVFRADLPVGVYRIEETKAPDGYYSTDKSVTVNFTSKIYNDQWETLSFTAEYENAQTSVTVYLRDDLTLNELASAVLSVTESDGTQAKTWVTAVEDGYEIRGLKTGVEYTISEIEAREGYMTEFTDSEMISENAYVTEVSGNTLGFVIEDVTTAVTDGGDLDKTTVPEETTITLYNSYVTGDINLVKYGETRESVLSYVKSLFGVEGKTLEGVEFTVYAVTDISHPDGVSGIVCRAGEIASVNVRDGYTEASGSTDSSGKLSFTGMYLGEYAVTETKSLSGYVMLEEPVYVSLEYAGGYTDNFTVVNEAIEVLNRLEDTGASAGSTATSAYEAEGAPTGDDFAVRVWAAAGAGAAFIAVLMILIYRRRGGNRG